MDLDQVKHDIEQWIVNFVEVPHPSLGGWPPCPYARQARLEKTFDVRLGRHPFWNLSELSTVGMGDMQVIIFAYDPTKWKHKEFAHHIDMANKHYLIPNDLIALEDHPEDSEIVNGVSMNQGTYAMILVQSLSDLNQKAKLMGRKGFYDKWPDEYLQALFHHREDPRK
jgi:hypothetical protein